MTSILILLAVLGAVALLLLGTVWLMAQMLEAIYRGLTDFDDRDSDQ